MARSLLNSAQMQIARRGRQLRNIWVAEGHRGIIDRVRTAVANWMRPKRLVWPVLREDMLAADLSRPRPCVDLQNCVGWRNFDQLGDKSLGPWFRRPYNLL